MKSSSTIITIILTILLINACKKYTDPCEDPILCPEDINIGTFKLYNESYFWLGSSNKMYFENAAGEEAVYVSEQGQLWNKNSPMQVAYCVEECDVANLRATGENIHNTLKAGTRRITYSLRTSLVYDFDAETHYRFDYISATCYETGSQGAAVTCITSYGGESESTIEDQLSSGQIKSVFYPQLKLRDKTFDNVFAGYKTGNSDTNGGIYFAKGLGIVAFRNDQNTDLWIRK